MRTATLHSFRRLGLVLTAVFALTQAPAVHAQASGELVVQPGVGTLNDAIENDTNRPSNRVYVLTRGAYYGVNRRITNDGYTLRLKAAAGTGARPVVYPGLDNAGASPGSRYFTLTNNARFTGIYFLAVDPTQGEVATAFALNKDNMRLTVRDCVFQGGRSRLIEINAQNTKLYFRDSQFRNLVRNDGSSNGRPIDYRTVGGDSLVVINTSFLNVSGYLVRYDGPVLKTAIFDHNTIYVTGRQLTTNSFATQVINFRFTNNLVVNAYGFGQTPPAEGVEPNGVVIVDSLDAGIDNGFTESQRKIEIRDNGYVITSDLQAYYDERTAAGDPLAPYALIDDSAKEYAAANASVILRDNETYTINFTKPPDLTDYLAYLRKFRNGAADPGTFTFGSSKLFPADQPPPEDLSYPTTNPAYTAAQASLPLGDLNYFPAAKAAYEAGGGLSVDSETDPSAGGFVIRSAYPNPTTGAASVKFDLATSAAVALDVYDTLGRRVLSVGRQSLAAGTGHQVAVDASALPSGVYLLRLTAETGGDIQVRTGRLTVTR